MAHLSNSLGQKHSIDREGKKFLSKMLENGRGFNTIVGVASKFHARFARKIIMEPGPIHEILHPPLPYLTIIESVDYK